MRRLLVPVAAIVPSGYSPPLPPSPRVIAELALLSLVASAPVVAPPAVIAVISD